MSMLVSKEMTFPFRFDASGGVAATADPVEAAASRLRSLILTTAGERVMRPGLGVSSRAMLFDSDTDFASETLREHLRSQVSSTEPTVELVDVTVDQDNDSAVTISIAFRLRPFNEVFQASTHLTPAFFSE